MTIEDACQITNGQLVNSRSSPGSFRGVSINSRTLRSGNAFLCLKGERADGHCFAPAARRNGAALIVADHARAKQWRRWNVPVLGVDDPLTALGDLAASFQSLFPTRYIAVTGSVGKTTTKELIAAALAARYRVFKSPGNFNNLIGIPLALLARNLRAANIDQYGVLEFGMSTPGEIARLTDIVRPQWGVVTRIAPSHLMQMGSLAAIARAKRELFDHAGPDAVAFLNNDDLYQRHWQSRWSRPTVTYAMEENADFVASRVKSLGHGGLGFLVNGRHRVELSLAGLHNVPNALAAIAVARHLRVPFPSIATALKKVRPVGQRSKITRIGKVTLIEDCYNANPASTLAALQTLATWPGAIRRIAVLGAMRELGPREVTWHRRVGRLATASTDLLVTVGQLAGEFAAGVRSKTGRPEVVFCPDRHRAARILKQLIRPGDVILLKASHSEHFEEIAEQLTSVRVTSARTERD